MPKSISIIISTYNNPQWLQKTLWSYLFQSIKVDEIIIADDGSDNRTKELVEEFSLSTDITVKHIWHEDIGFRKCTILNKAIAAASSEYLIFTDQDCIARKDFIEAHATKAERGYILSAGVVWLSMETSDAITFDDLKSGDAFRLKWLRKRGLKFNFKCTKLLQSKLYASIMNSLTPTKASWNGGNASGWRDDLIKVNGYNNDMAYGGEDRELGERLFNCGIKSKQLRYSAVCLHLDHKRPYKNIELIKINEQIRKNTRNLKIKLTPNGIKELQ